MYPNVMNFLAPFWLLSSPFPLFMTTFSFARVATWSAWSALGAGPHRHADIVGHAQVVLLFRCVSDDFWRLGGKLGSKHYINGNNNSSNNNSNDNHDNHSKIVKITNDTMHKSNDYNRTNIWLIKGQITRMRIEQWFWSVFCVHDQG